MSYQPYLIADFKTGIETDKQPWIIPDDAQEVLFDGYVHHGVITKRDGYNFLADGQRGGAPYCESRIVRRITDEATGQTNNVDPIPDFSLTNTPIRRGTVTISDGVEDHTDDGLGTFPTADAGTINYTTGLIEDFEFNANSGNAVTATYDYHPGNPVMMIANFTNSTDIKELLVADTQFLNKYNSTTNRLDDISTVTNTGTNSDFFTWTQYPTIEDTSRIVFTNNVDQIQTYDGTTIRNWYPSIVSVEQTQETELGTGVTGPYTRTLSGVSSSAPIAPQSVRIVGDSGVDNTVVDDGNGNLISANDNKPGGFGTINYDTGAVSVTFDNAIPVGNDITFDFSLSTNFIITTHKLLNHKDRLIALRTTESGGIIYPQRIRISGFGQRGDDFRTSILDSNGDATATLTAPGSGVIDIPSPYWIQGATFNRDDIIIYTERETWALRYTNNDVVPFTLEKIDGTRGNKAGFAPISYLNISKAYSQVGFTYTDGYQVRRYDEKIPDFSFDVIDQEKFNLCFSGVVEDDQNHLMLYPRPGETKSNEILVNNYEENNFSVYRIPYSTLGTFFESFDIIWDDLTKEGGIPNWLSFGQEYSTWNDIGYNKDQPISIAGGHTGEIWRTGNTEGEDNPLRIYDITETSKGPLVVLVTSDWHNYQVGDYAFLSGMTDVVITGETFGSGDGTEGPYNYDINHVNITPGTISIVADPGGTPQTVTDDGAGNLEGDGTGTIDYLNGRIEVTFDSVVPDAADNIEIDYDYSFELNFKKGEITSISSDTVFEVTFDANNPVSMASYTTGGIVSRTIPFEFVTKNFNPYANAGSKVRCGWIYLYIDATKTTETDASGQISSAKIQIEVYSNDRYPGFPTQVTTVDIPYEYNISSFDDRSSLKVLRKIFINQTSRFIQFRFRNTQPGTNIRIHAIEPGFMPAGRMI